MLALRRWRASHLFLAWGTWWAGLALVTLTPAIRAANRLAGPGQHGTASVGYADGTLSMKITDVGQTLWSSAIDIGTLALWFAGPPLLLWLLWFATRPRRHSPESVHPTDLQHPDARPAELPNLQQTDFVPPADRARAEEPRRDPKDR
jgi:hypothetical protein